jgi:hypothetical protein
MFRRKCRVSSFGVRRQSEAATALWFGVPPSGGRAFLMIPPKGGTPNNPKRRRAALQSRTRGNTMARFNNRLDHVRVAAPCKADWDQMIGDERVRFCSQCSLNVYNLSSMSRSDAQSLIARTEGRLCVRVYRRSDGSIITKDCPVGLRAIRRRMSYASKAISSTVIGLLAGLGVYVGTSRMFPIASNQDALTGVMVAPSRMKPPLQSLGEITVEKGELELRMGGTRGMPIRKRPASGKGRNGASNR